MQQSQNSHSSALCSFLGETSAIAAASSSSSSSFPAATAAVNSVAPHLNQQQQQQQQSNTSHSSAVASPSFLNFDPNSIIQHHHNNHNHSHSHNYNHHHHYAHTISHYHQHNHQQHTLRSFASSSLNRPLSFDAAGTFSGFSSTAASAASLPQFSLQHTQSHQSLHQPFQNQIVDQGQNPHLYYRHSIAVSSAADIASATKRTYLSHKHQHQHQQQHQQQSQTQSRSQLEQQQQHQQQHSTSVSSNTGSFLGRLANRLKLTGRHSSTNSTNSNSHSQIETDTQHHQHQNQNYQRQRQSKRLSNSIATSHTTTSTATVATAAAATVASTHLGNSGAISSQAPGSFSQYQFPQQQHQQQQQQLATRSITAPVSISDSSTGVDLIPTPPNLSFTTVPPLYQQHQQQQPHQQQPHQSSQLSSSISSSRGYLSSSSKVSQNFAPHQTRESASHIKTTNTNSNNNSNSQLQSGYEDRHSNNIGVENSHNNNSNNNNNKSGTREHHHQQQQQQLQQLQLQQYQTHLHQRTLQRQMSLASSAVSPSHHHYQHNQHNHYQYQTESHSDCSANMSATATATATATAGVNVAPIGASAFKEPRHYIRKASGTVCESYATASIPATNNAATNNNNSSNNTSNTSNNRNMVDSFASFRSTRSSTASSSNKKNKTKLSSSSSSHSHQHHPQQQQHQHQQKQQQQRPQVSAEERANLKDLLKSDLLAIAEQMVYTLFDCDPRRAASSSNSADMAHIQSLRPLYDFISHAVYRTRSSPTIIVLALLYLCRLKRRTPHSRGSPGAGHRLLIASLLLATKFLLDDAYHNKSWMQVSQNMFHLNEVNQMELEMLALLDWHVGVSPKQWREYVQVMEGKLERRWHASGTSHRFESAGITLRTELCEPEEWIEQFVVPVGSEQPVVEVYFLDEKINEQTVKGIENQGVAQKQMYENYYNTRLESSNDSSSSFSSTSVLASASEKQQQPSLTSLVGIGSITSRVDSAASGLQCNTDGNCSPDVNKTAVASRQPSNNWSAQQQQQQQQQQQNPYHLPPLNIPAFSVAMHQLPSAISSTAKADESSSAITLTASLPGIANDAGCAGSSSPADSVCRFKAGVMHVQPINSTVHYSKHSNSINNVSVNICAVVNGAGTPPSSSSDNSATLGMASNKRSFEDMQLA